MVLLLLTIVPTAGFAGQEPDRVYGSFIVVINGLDRNEAEAQSVVAKTFASYEIKEVSYLSRDTFVMNLGQDPGLDEIIELGKQNPAITRIEANWSYRIPPIPRPKIERPVE